MDKVNTARLNVAVDLDEYFTVGPGGRFQRNDVFTDRRAYVEMFLDRLHQHSGRRFSAATYTDLRRSAKNLIVLHGDGGIGKTTLLDHLCEVFRTAESAALPERRAALVIDFADPVNQTFETMLLRLRAALSQLGSRWLCFDTALALYWERSHPGVALGAFIGKTGLLDADNRRRFADQAIGLLDSLAGGTGLISAGASAVGALSHAIHHNVALRRAKEEFPPFPMILDEPQPEKALTYLPVLLGWDLEQLRRKHGAEAICLFDTFEMVQDLPHERGFLEDLIARTVYLMPNVLFVVAGRRPLLWHDPVRGIGLQYGGPARWPGLGGSGSADQFPLEGLAEADADEYLCERLTEQDGAPAIADDVRERIIAGSGGSPLYLDLSVSLFRNTVLRGDPVTPDQFGEPLPELVLRIMRDLSTTERDLLRAASLFQAFDEDILSAALPQVRLREIERFLGKSFVRRHDEAWPRFRLHESLRRSILACDRYMDDGWVDSERARRLDLALECIVDVGLAVWAPTVDRVLAAEHSRRAVTAMLLCVHAALEHGVLPKRLELLAYTVSQLGHWSVLTALPQAEGAAAPLRRLVEVARIAGDGATDAQARYGAARTVAAAGSEHPYDGYVTYELALLSQIVRADSDGDRYFSMLESAAAPLSEVAPWGRAGIALRQSRLGDALRYADRAAGHALDKARTQDLLGHIYLQSGDFERAAELFRATLAHAREAGAPVWLARALRHCAMALMWTDPDGARELLPEASDLNAAMAYAVGLAQCDLIAAMVAAGTGDFDEGRRLLARCRDRAREMNASEPYDVVETLIGVALGEREVATAATVRLVADVQAGVAVPAWAAVAALWLDRPDLWDFSAIGWHDDAKAARQRWMRPLERLRALH